MVLKSWYIFNPFPCKDNNNNIISLKYSLKNVFFHIFLYKINLFGTIRVQKPVMTKLCLHQSKVTACWTTRNISMHLSYCQPWLTYILLTFSVMKIIIGTELFYLFWLLPLSSYHYIPLYNLYLPLYFLQTQAWKLCTNIEIILRYTLKWYKREMIHQVLLWFSFPYGVLGAPWALWLSLLLTGNTISVAIQFPMIGHFRWIYIF